MSDLEQLTEKLDRLEAELVEREGDVGRVRAALFRLAPHVLWDYSREAIEALDRVAGVERRSRDRG